MIGVQKPHPSLGEGALTWRTGRPFDGPIYEVIIGLAFALAAGATLRRPQTAAVPLANTAT